MDDSRQARSADTAPGEAKPPLTARIAAEPLHNLVRRQISEHILVGDWAPGAVLPAEVDLARDLGVSVGTVRRALSELVREGLLSRRRKTGTIVTGRKPHHTLSHFFQFFRLHRRDGGRLHSTTVTRAVVRRRAGDDEIADLGLGAEDEVFDIARTRAIDGRAIMHEHLVLPAAVLPGFPPPEMPDLLYRHLLDRYGIRIAAVRENIRAEAFTDEDRRLLDVASATAALVIEEVAYDQTGRATIRGSHRAVTDHFMYVNELS
jgi:GntR family transcriptional regulator